MLVILAADRAVLVPLDAGPRLLRNAHREDDECAIQKVCKKHPVRRKLLSFNNAIVYPMT